MKMLFVLVLSVMSLQSFAQGLLFEEDKDKLLPGPDFFSIGNLDQSNDLYEFKSTNDRFTMRITSQDNAINNAVEQLKYYIWKVKKANSGTLSVACMGKTNILNGELVIQELNGCMDLDSKKIVLASNSLSAADKDILAQKIQDTQKPQATVFVLNEDKKPDVQITKGTVISSDSCRDGGTKVRTELNFSATRLNIKNGRTFLGKSAAGDYLELVPVGSSDATVAIYLCPRKNIINGTAVDRKVINIEYVIKNLVENSCNVNDLTGMAQVRFESSYINETITFLPLDKSGCPEEQRSSTDNAAAGSTRQ